MNIDKNLMKAIIDRFGTNIDIGNNPEIINEILTQINDSSEIFENSSPSPNADYDRNYDRGYDKEAYDRDYAKYDRETGNNSVDEIRDLILDDVRTELDEKIIRRIQDRSQ